MICLSIHQISDQKNSEKLLDRVATENAQRDRRNFEPKADRRAAIQILRKNPHKVPFAHANQPDQNRIAFVMESSGADRPFQGDAEPSSRVGSSKDQSYSKDI
jgi:hypothetical protein